MSNSISTLFNYLTIGGGKDYDKTMSESSKQGRPVSAQKLSRSKKATSVSEADIQQVWDYWVSKMRATSKRKPVLDSTRRQFIGAAIFDYELQGCLDAIDGCAISEFHMGRNKMNKRYDSIELIFRDAEHIEKFHDFLDKSTQEKEDW